MPTEGLEKPVLKREIKMNTTPLPELKDATFTITSHDDKEAKMVVAYDIAGNAIETSIADILENKYRPSPDFNIVPCDTTPIDLGFQVSTSKTRSGKTYRRSECKV